MIRPVALVLAVLLVSCTGKKEMRDLKYEQYSISVSASSVKIPESLWDRIELIAAGKADVHASNSSSAGGSHGAEKHGTVNEGHGEEAPAHPQEGHAAPAEHGGSGETLANKKKPIEFKPITVFLIEESRGVLKGKNHKIEFGPGGGEIDLRDFVNPEEKGAFRLGFAFELNRSAAAAASVFYVSNAVKRKIAGDPFDLVWGGGCKTYFDISARFDKLMAENGFLVHTNQNRHLSALAGTYVFAVPNDLSLGIAQVTVKDSRFRNLQCRL